MYIISVLGASIWQTLQRTVHHVRACKVHLVLVSWFDQVTTDQLTESETVWHSPTSPHLMLHD